MALHTKLCAAVTALTVFGSHPSPAAAPGAGATVDELIRVARAMNPEAAAMALEADAAEARADAAGALDDPQFQAELQLMRNTPSYAPTGDEALVTYRVVQMFPLWGKRTLKQEAAEALGRGARARQLMTENEIAFRVKEAYAQYHLAHLAAEETGRLIGTLDTMGRLAQARYGQNLAKQQEVTTVAAEKAAMQSDLARMQAERRRSQARLNGLLARQPNAPLVEEPMPRAVPPLETLAVDALVERALAHNPALREQAAQIEAADKSRALADREWYPDLELSLGVMQRQRDIEGYETMVGFNIPLQVPKRQAMIREAGAMAGAARAKLDQLRLEITTELHAAHAELVALGQRKRFLRETTLPQARIAFEGAVQAYRLAREEFLMVLVAEQTLRRAIVDWLNVQYEEQIRLAEIERLIGGEL